MHAIQVELLAAWVGMVNVSSIRSAVDTVSDFWVVGDVHGALSSLRTLLRRARLTDFEDNWMGDGATLVLLGDLMDRGPSGLGVVRLVRHLERQARESGGEVISLLGNHEAMMLAACRFRDGLGDPYGLYDYWKQNGGQLHDLNGLDTADLNWLEARPPMHRHADWLLVHADSRLYLDLGESTQGVADQVTRLLQSNSADEWLDFLNVFAERHMYAGEHGHAEAAEMLDAYGGKRLVHGHTPVFALMGVPPTALMSPQTYAKGLVLDLDSAMAYQQGAGFMVRLDADPGRLDSPERTGVLETVYLTERELGLFTPHPKVKMSRARLLRTR
jgi:Calcineurin-like phosphoesterase